jgi:hypothetical protein
VVVEEGYYFEALNFGGKNIRVTGMKGPELTTLKATEFGAPAVTFANGEGPGAIFEGFRVRDGEGASETTSAPRDCGSTTTCIDYTTTTCGGGIYANLTSPTLRDLWLDANVLPPYSSTTSGNDSYTVATFGGGGCFIGSGARLERVTMSGNSADQGGGLFRLTLPVAGSTNAATVEKLSNSVGGAHGLLYAFDSLYVMVNEETLQGRGFYRVRDTDGDDRFDSVELLRKLDGGVIGT